MKAKLKELIDRADPFREWNYDMFLLIPSGKLYNGFFGKNGYDNIIILGKLDGADNWTRIDSGSSDVFTIALGEFRGIIDFDIPHELGCIRIYLPKELHIGHGLSTVKAEYGW